MILNWNTTKEEFETIVKIVERAENMGILDKSNRMTSLMDVQAVHCNDMKLDLEKLLTFPEFDFAHDVLGIKRHMNRTTGKLQDFFVPRCALND